MSIKMEEINACMVLLDISGYTQFIKYRTTSLLHAEQIITELLDSVIEHAEYPLILNKLEGDAALLYSPINNPEPTLVSIYQQVEGFIKTFRNKQKELMQEGAGGCACDACQKIGNLNIKAVMHCGPVILKQVRQFEELAGEPVILIHRLLKNNVPGDGYILFTEDVYKILRNLMLPKLTAYVEHYDHMSPCKVYPLMPYLNPLPKIDQSPVSSWSGMLENLRLWRSLIFSKLKGSRRQFHHLPNGSEKNVN